MAFRSDEWLCYRRFYPCSPCGSYNFVFDSYNPRKKPSFLE
jgi:hypothetical protein